MDDTMLVKIIFLGFFGIVAVYSFVLALYYLNRKNKEKKCTCKTYGKIIDNIEREEKVYYDDGTFDIVTRWHSLCEYTVGEKKYVRETIIGAFLPKEVGKSVIVYYNPNNCHEFYIDGNNISGLCSIICLFLGILSVIIIYLIIKY